MSYSYNKNYPANAGKTNYGLNSFAAYLAKEDEKKKEIPPYKPESQKKTLTPFEKMADISKNITGGARIKQNVEDALTKNYPSGNYKGIFDGIDEKKIESNISLADDVIKKNTAGGAYRITPRENLPWLHDGLALFYASAEQGDSKAANAARKLAYTETKEQEKPKNNQTAKTESSPDFFGEALKRFETGKEQSASETIRHENISYNENDKKTDTEQVDSYPVLDKENVMSLISPAYEASKELTEHIKTGFDDYDGNIFFDIITAGTTVLRLNPITRKAATRSKYILRQIWKAGADLYLRGYKGYDFSADLLEHSLQENPNDLVFYDDSRVADIIRSDNNFLKKVDGLTKKIENKIPFNDTDRQHKFDVGDMYYSIHGCNLEITNINYNDDGTKDISVHISDNYDYTKIWTMMDGKGISLGSIANDAGTVSTWLDAINSYKVDIYLTLRR